MALSQKLSSISGLGTSDTIELISEIPGVIESN